MSLHLRIALLCILMPGITLSDELTDEERKVWALEEAYYEYAKANDPEGYLSLFSNEVIGWPTLDPRPKGKDEVSQWIGIVHSDPSEVWNYEIEPFAIRSFGEIVVVHYRLREYFVAADNGEVLRSEHYRITHTWFRENGQWKIISGMGGRFN